MNGGAPRALRFSALGRARPGGWARVGGFTYPVSRLRSWLRCLQLSTGARVATGGFTCCGRVGSALLFHFRWLVGLASVLLVLTKEDVQVHGESSGELLCGPRNMAQVLRAGSELQVAVVVVRNVCGYSVLGL